MASEFKVVIADESHFLKNAQVKKTTASLPVIKSLWNNCLCCSNMMEYGDQIEIEKRLINLSGGQK
ncbi:hypothetical protein CFP56_036905 [Quercus suber]|uniref:SNF2 N-terminal domain-containing protein n=1 Tax=Quercus suber TaxID=58331 RepID=A0AAW0LPJ3_QUESU